MLIQNSKNLTVIFTVLYGIVSNYFSISTHGHGEASFSILNSAYRVSPQSCRRIATYASAPASVEHGKLVPKKLFHLHLLSIAPLWLSPCSVGRGMTLHELSPVS